jgi:AraC-like DNA-binding protein
MDYREQPPPAGLAPWLACTWTRTVGASGIVRVLPDGCTDLIAHSDGRVAVAGPDTEPVLSPVGPNARIVAVRFRPGAGAAVLGVPLRSLRDERPTPAELWGEPGRRLQEELAAAPTDAARVRLLLAVVAARRQGLPDPLVAAAAARLQSRSRLRVGALASDLGLSERQLLRRFDHAVGYGPKVLARVLRLQRLLDLPEEADLAWAAQLAGYADQTHMSAEVRRLAGLTPAALRAEHVRYPQDALADAA